MEKKSCGAILYTFNLEGKLGIVLGTEGLNCADAWLPFKGGCKDGETEEETAIREIYEETCGLVEVESIDLKHVFSTKRKIYHIGICEVPYDIIDKFERTRNLETRDEFREKRQIKFLPYPEVLKDPSVHNISKSSILFYKNFLDKLKNKGTYKVGLRARYLGITELPPIKSGKPVRFNASYTPQMERIIERERVWRKADPIINVA